jgi:hypothetical protein
MSASDRVSHRSPVLSLSTLSNAGERLGELELANKRLVREKADHRQRIEELEKMLASRENPTPHACVPYVCVCVCVCACVRA